MFADDSFAAEPTVSTRELTRWLRLLSRGVALGPVSMEEEGAVCSRLVRPDQGSEHPGPSDPWVVIPDASKGDGVVSTVAVSVAVLLTGAPRKRTEERGAS